MSDTSPKLKVAIPKGSLERSVLPLLKRAGYEIADLARSYRPRSNDPDLEFKVLRPQEIPSLIADGAHDIGISGIDWVRESRVEGKVCEILDLKVGRVKLVLAVPSSWSDVKGVDDLFNYCFVSTKVG